MTDASDPNDPSAPERPDETASRGQSMWGSRFTAKPAELMQAINVSIGFDHRLAPQDLQGSRAHAAMLTKVGVISSEDGARIQAGLDNIETEMATGCFEFLSEREGAAGHLGLDLVEAVADLLAVFA